jgi:uncharacterized delta-60 repeat protein
MMLSLVCLGEGSPGDLDPTFGVGGKVTTAFDFAQAALALVLQPDGKLVAAGFLDSVGTVDFVLARYLPDGSLDPTFGMGGWVITGFEGPNIASGLVLQPDGKLVVAGNVCQGSLFEVESCHFGIARHLPDGRLDPTFGTGGKLTTDFGNFDGASALVLQPDGKLVAAGSAVSGGDLDFALARYESQLVLEVAIDIKPGSSPNTINPKSNGVIPVAILTTESFDATLVEPQSVRFGPKGAREAHQKGYLEDVNHDGEPDLVLHFRTQNTGIKCGDTSASLTGATLDGVPIQGTGSIKTVGCKK